jgi:hypothetical protein
MRDRVCGGRVRRGVGVRGGGGLKHASCARDVGDQPAAHEDCEESHHHRRLRIASARPASARTPARAR